MYTAEEEWREDTSTLSALRHPNILQLYGMASSSGVYAAVYHGDLIPFESFLDHYSHSHFLTLDVWDYFTDESSEACRHFWSVYPGEAIFLKCGYWIRPSTGRLCMDFIPCDTSLDVPSLGLGLASRPDGISSFNTPNREAAFISSITLEQYESLCYECFGKERAILIPAQSVTRLGALVQFPHSSQQKVPVGIASLPALLDLDHWFWPWIYETMKISRHASNPAVNWGRGGVPVDGEFPNSRENEWTRYFISFLNPQSP
ncbi:hypothetical protein MSAN_02450100 [Mycena sanguinolenta]|uniref:Uncharacterized protein n=1 Tax=Mycena sanguinolenta TaxID=230812 RepID=A0A8H6WY61_9AGAR|nr:hypothetical protein MSAN_02450100 [Mycena sanguinolenta]